MTGDGAENPGLGSGDGGAENRGLRPTHPPPQATVFGSLAATRVLVLGAGLIGARHVAHLSALPGLDLAGVVDPDPARGAEFADLSQVDVPVDGVVIATPTPSHVTLAEAAAAKGWPMLIEKPLAGTLAEADRIVTATQGLPVLVGHHRRHHPRVKALRALLDDGAIGQPVTASVIWAMRKPDAYFDTWRQGEAGSPVMINLVHEVDLLRHLFGDLTDIAGFGAAVTRRAARVESGAVALRFASGMTATISFADCAPSPWGFEAGTGENPNIGTTGQDMMWITGTKGAVSFPSLTLWGGAADWGQAAAARPGPEGAGPVPLDAQLLHFADVIAGRAAPLIDAADARASLAATLEIAAAVAV